VTLPESDAKIFYKVRKPFLSVSRLNQCALGARAPAQLSTSVGNAILQDDDNRSP
jgi:hypothetical protein